MRLNPTLASLAGIYSFAFRSWKKKVYNKKKKRLQKDAVTHDVLPFIGQMWVPQFGQRRTLVTTGSPGPSIYLSKHSISLANTFITNDKQLNTYL